MEPSVVAPALAVGIALAGLVGGFTARWLLWLLATRRARTLQDPRDPLVLTLRSLEWPAFALISLGGAYFASLLARPLLTPPLADALGRALGALTTLAVSVGLGTLATRLIRAYTAGPGRPTGLSLPLIIGVQSAIAVAGGLLIAYIAGLPITPPLLLIAMALLVLAVALRNLLPDLASGLFLALSGEIRPGDYVQLSTGEEGVVVEVSWRFTTLRTPEEALVVIPNSRVMSATVVRRGRAGAPSRRANRPFRFYTRLVLKEHTGLRASTLRELAEALRTVPEGVLYYHTLYYVQEYDYLVPQPPSEFASWIADSLQYRDLAERVSTLDPVAMESLEEYRRRLLEMVEDYLREGRDGRTAPPGEEFYFIRANLYLLPTDFVAYDLVDLARLLPRVDASSLFYHLFEARPLEGRPENDLSRWLREELGEVDLARQVAALDPYSHTAEGLRHALIHALEERLGVPLEVLR